jgi:hypothetical protein
VISNFTLRHHWKIMAMPMKNALATMTALIHLSTRSSELRRPKRKQMHLFVTAVVAAVLFLRTANLLFTWDVYLARINALSSSIVW